MNVQKVMQSCKEIKSRCGIEVFQNEKAFSEIPCEEYDISSARSMQISLLLSQTNLGNLLVNGCVDRNEYEVTRSVAVQSTGLNATLICELMNAMIWGCVGKNLEMQPQQLKPGVLSWVKKVPSFIATPCEQILLNTFYYDRQAAVAIPPASVRAFETERLGFAHYRQYEQARSESPEKALDLLQKAAHQGYGQAQQTLGLHYYTGDITKVDYQKAWFYLTIPGIPVSKEMLAALMEMKNKRAFYQKANWCVLAMAIVLCVVSCFLCVGATGFAITMHVIALLSALLVLCYLIFRYRDKFYVALLPMVVMSMICGLQCVLQLV